MRILMSGSTGLLGSHLSRALRRAGHTVVPLVRSPGQAEAILWQPDVPIFPAAVSGFDVAIHLAGEPVLGRWTAAKKHRIWHSRVDGTQNLAEALAHAPAPPQVFLCASGINVYGDCGGTLVTEMTPPGQGFLPDVCRAWEAACDPLQGHARVVNLRIGVVLTPAGGMLHDLLPLFRLGLGSSVGAGQQYVSWISLQDVVAAVLFLLNAPVTGAVNVVAPHPVTARAFAQELARVLHRPLLLRVPVSVVRALLGELAEETLLSSVRAAPAVLQQHGFQFAQPALPEALTMMLGSVR